MTYLRLFFDLSRITDVQQRTETMRLKFRPTPSLILFIVMLCLQTTCFASASSSEFQKAIQDAQALCPNLQCPRSAITLKPIGNDDGTALPAETQKFLSEQAVERSSAWDDTILESDYFTSDDDIAALSSVALLYQNNQPIGYRMTFAIRAWDTSTCPFDAENPQLDACQEGQIVDAAFVSLDLKEIFQDETSYAHFVSNRLHLTPQPDSAARD